MVEAQCKKVLSNALKADEDGHKEMAILLYGQSVELILSIKDVAVKEQMTHFAHQAMDRAEELKKTILSTQTLAMSSNQSIQNLELSGSQEYSLQEKRVLYHSSIINNLTYVPFINEDLKEQFKYPVPFTDKNGHLRLAPQQKREIASWTRIRELVDEPHIVAGKIVDYTSIKQTVVSDCSFVASLAVAAMYEQRFKKPLVSSIIYPQNVRNQPLYNPSGKYTVRLHVNGIPRKVVIDDYLPVGKRNQLLCSYSKDQSEFWVSMLEKAYMKMMGGYDFPGSNSNIDLHALTGWIPERISTSSDPVKADPDGNFHRLMTGITMGRCLITVATGEISDAESERSGLVSTHAYAVLDIKECNGIKLFQLKNPWSHLRWKGNYSEMDTVNWTSDLKNELNYDPSQAEKEDNGIFWIDYMSVLKFFDVFYINWNPAVFRYTNCIHQMWQANCGPVRDGYSVGDNPQFSLKVSPGVGSLWILLTRHITDIADFRDNKEYITLLVYENNGRKVYYPNEPPPLIDGVRINSPHYLCKIKLPPSTEKNYTLVMSQYMKTTNIYYTLRAFCRDKFIIKAFSEGAVKKEITGEWSGPTAGGCGNYPATNSNNPKYLLNLSDTTNDLVIELRAPKSFQIGIELKLHDSHENVGDLFTTKTSGNFRNGFAVLDVCVPAGKYVLVVATFYPGQEGPYFLNVKSNKSFQIGKL